MTTGAVPQKEQAQPASGDFDDGDDDSSRSFSDEQFSSEEERDEVKEIQKLSQKDNNRVQLWRFAATFALLLTAFAVTFSTYTFLKNEESDNFTNAFEQFSRTVGDAARQQQQDLRAGIEAYTDFVSAYALGTNQTWPYIYISGYEVYAKDYLNQAHCEIMSFFPKVYPELRDSYVAWATANVQNWVWESHMIQKGSFERLIDIDGKESYNPYISKAVGPGQFEPDIERDDYYLPSWQFSPPPSSYGLINWNMQSIADYAEILPGMHKLRNETLCSKVRPYTVGVPAAMSHEEHDARHSKLKDSSQQNPHSFCWRPIHRDATDYDSEIVGVTGFATAWDEALLDLLPANVMGIHSIIKNDCNQTYSYNIQGGDAIFLGEGDMHEAEFDNMKVIVPLNIHTHPDLPTTEGHCQYAMHIYPSAEFKEAYDSNTPEIFAVVVATTFVVVALFFLVYDIFVQRRNLNLTLKAAQTNAIVTSLLPEHMRHRLTEVVEQKQAAKKAGNNLKTFMNDGQQQNTAKLDSKPLADLYLETTVLFADISGFTAWSSVRDPTQVFVLLETLFQEFDQIAKRRRVFKVETVGDCYVAVCGLPDPRKDHAVGMTRFAKDILGRMQITTKALEITLGPDTGDLGLRVGMHSGPVTAGVLRGERSRFQLFGDTMHVCQRIEASGMRGRIHCSKETAELLKRAGKESWLEQRKSHIVAAGKGSLSTYWVTVKGERGAESAGSMSVTDEIKGTTTKYGKNLPGLDEKACRLIDWNVEMLLQILKQMVARREAAPESRKSKLNRMSSADSSVDDGCNSVHKGTPLEEVREIITLPEFDAKALKNQQDPEKVEIPEDVTKQLHSFVSVIASMYHDNPFHNFEHASHVVMSVTKLMNRIVRPAMADESAKGLASLHDHTYGINSDPLTQFACAFSALIHDVDHAGVSNAQLVKEDVPIAKKYQRSVLEQNSLDISWDLLMSEEYDSLREFIFPKDSEMTRFRQLVVNSVMATDIVDKQLKELRNGRWDKAFKTDDNASDEECPRDEVNRKATIVIEHIIQASDISHTMQHWHVYRKWNQNLFEELYVAYINGRMEKDPADFWYKGEFGFFDFYIIPLTRKLKDCGVFGVSSDEYLNYAQKNREEWELKGQEVIAEMIVECRAKYGVKKGGSDLPLTNVDF